MRGARAGERGWQGQELRDPSRPPPAERPCLRCRKFFESEGAHHQLCLACASTAGETRPYAV